MTRVSTLVALLSMIFLALAAGTAAAAGAPKPAAKAEPRSLEAQDGRKVYPDSTELLRRFRQGRFRAIGTFAALPASVRIGLPDLAERGAAYSGTDMRIPELPSGQLLLAGESDDVLFVHYRMGGFATTQRIALAARLGPKVYGTPCEFQLNKWANSVEALKAVVAGSVEPMNAGCRSDESMDQLSKLREQLEREKALQEAAKSKARSAGK